MTTMLCQAKQAGIFYSTLYAKTIEAEWAKGFGGDASAWYLIDVNGDGMDDAVVYYAGGERKGQWWAALSDGRKFGEPHRIDPPEIPETEGLMCDADGDGLVDRVRHGNETWTVEYFDGETFHAAEQDWISGFGERQAGGRRNQTHKKQNPPPVIAYLAGSLDGQKGWACIVDASGRWFAVSNPSRAECLDLIEHNTYAAWRCAYEPQISGHEGTYDSGDPAVHDVQIKMLHDAGFTYVTLDVTNGEQEFVDTRARAFFESVRRWNENRRPGQRKLYANISLGRTRKIKGVDNWFSKLNLECKRAWDEFVTPYEDVYYHLNEKPLVIHMINTGYAYIDQYESWNGDRCYIDRCANRWMSGDQPGAHAGRPNTYGWIVPGMYGNAVDREMMPVMPGFWNGISYFDREHGDLYRSQWLRVIENRPDSVWVNSMNETWEHTSIEPSFMFNAREPHEGITMWTDLHGERMDDFYWVMTRQYMKLYMENRLYEGTCLQEYITEHRFSPIHKATQEGFEELDEAPRQTPVLLMPNGFLKRFDGEIVEDKGWRAALSD